MLFIWYTNSRVILWITDFLDKRLFRVTVDGKYSLWHEVVSGIPQGSILGPLLFILYITDLPSFCSDTHTKLYIYADDTKLYRHIFKSEDLYKLQDDIHKLNDWTDQWLLKLNVDKCCGMTYTANTSNLCNTKY